MWFYAMQAKGINYTASSLPLDWGNNKWVVRTIKSYLGLMELEEYSEEI